ncbi:MAG: tRNA uridine-5-carboxymethylaminomethyl(34) synthesis GTPase MnmE [Clostridia bacterium]|nr:tRNA uridine-5-carboxymethylaminomethyl(34) synthesis GTPase MnmE [Clostridia bacterium]
MLEDTIVALATPPGKAGVAIVRISGSNAQDILKAITKCDSEFLPRYMYLKDIYLKDIVDNALTVYFKYPNSYTGEDVVEIQCHGGYFIAQQVIEMCQSLGARMAEPGEYSKRAFLNGKLSFDQAEGIIDIINAESEAQAKAGSALAQGKLFDIISSIQTELTDILAEIEAKLDYPEYEYSDSDNMIMLNRLKAIENNLDELLQTKISGLMIKNGVKVAIVGAPNAGKSSLLNALTNTDKSIVTNIAGTTRDIVEAEYIFNGIVFRLFDTAGIRESEDVVEQIGINRAKESIQNADIVLKLIDLSNPQDIKVDGKPTITVYNKIDLTDQPSINNDNAIYISAKDGTNVENLKQMIFDNTMVNGYNTSQFYLSNTRHIECVTNARQALNNAINTFSTTTLDFVVADIHSCWQHLGEVSGVNSNERIIDRIFEKFCLGK